MEYHGSRLNPTEQKFYLKLKDTYQKRLLFTKADGITDEDSIWRCILAVEYDYPEMFYADFRNWKYRDYEDGWEIILNYRYDEKQYKAVQKEIDAVIDAMMLEMKKRNLTSVYQICGYIHGYIARHCEYEHEAVGDVDNHRSAYNIEGVFLHQKAVCKGIAMAFREFCRRYGIDAIVARGVSLQPGKKDYEKHAWNIIRVGDKSAQVDATWDMNMTLDGWPVRYDYFFQPDIEMMRDHQYVGYPICRKLKASYYEKSGTQFQELKELDTYIQKVVEKNKDADPETPFFLQFKLMNRKESEEEVTKYIIEQIQKDVTRGFWYNCVKNEAQSVFTYKIEWMK